MQIILYQEQHIEIRHGYADQIANDGSNPYLVTRTLEVRWLLLTPRP